MRFIVILDYKKISQNFSNFQAAFLAINNNSIIPLFYIERSITKQPNYSNELPKSSDYDALLKALDEIQKVKFGRETNLSSDPTTFDINEALYHFRMITGQVTNDELLGNILANFCIGK